MMSIKTIWIAAAAATIALALSGGVQADDWKATGEFGWFGVGKAHQIEEGHFYWVGEFSGTFFNDEGDGSLFHRAGGKCPAFFDANYNTNEATAGGYCVLSDTDGDKAFVTWESSGTPASGPGTFTYTGGTGKYEGISGTNTFVGVTQVNWADGTSTGFATWNR
jgi:hypothetical protein